MKNIIILVARMLLALVFIISGIGKFFSIPSTMAYISAVGLPSWLVFPTIAFEIVAGVMLVIGIYTKPVALLFAVFCVATAAVFHANLNDQLQMVMLLKNLAIAGGMLLLVATGPGTLAAGR